MKTAITSGRGRQDGILAIKIRCSDNDLVIGLLANYLPPDSFHYGKDPESFYLDNSLVYSDLSDCDLVVAGGDLNSRTREEFDYIADLDYNTLPRTNPDLDKNSHGEYFLQFLKDNRALICNGRVTPELNDFTFLSPRGRSVPDYIYCPADHIKYCTSMKVIRVSDIINQFNLPLPHSLPDHSVLISEFDLSSFVNISSDEQQQPTEAQRPQNIKSKSRKNIRKINETFMCSEETSLLIQQTISKLENSLQNQNSLDTIYSEIKTIFLSEIEKLPSISPSSNKKGRQKLRKAAPFWNSELQVLWDSRCFYESVYCSFKCDGRSQQQRLQKQNLLVDFKNAQQLFDKKFRQLKRQYEN